MQIPLDLQYYILEFLQYKEIFYYLKQYPSSKSQKFLNRVYNKRVEVTDISEFEKERTIDGVRWSLYEPAYETVWDLYEWYENGELHRDNGPAVIFGNSREWWQHGKMVKYVGKTIWDTDSDDEINYMHDEYY